MSAQQLHIASLIGSSIACVFFLIGIIGFSSEKQSVTNVSWGHAVSVSGMNEEKMWLGLQKGYDNTNSVMTEIHYHDHNQCTSDWCHNCDVHGQNCFALLVIALIFAFITCLQSTSLVQAFNAHTQIHNIIAPFVSLVFSVVGWSLFINKCFDPVNKHSTLAFKYAFLLMYLVTVLQICAAYISKPASTPVPTEEPKENTV